LGAGGSLAAAGDVTLGAAGATFDISGAGSSQTIGALNGVAGTSLALGDNSLTFGSAGNGAFDGLISGGGGLVKVGAGVQTLSGANTFGGGVTLNAGGLVLG
ncbi:autotransporter-associated beta strand repeat-containing protein, partial [Klebsiella pneumoniae]|uniref:autotransporter-associated beta strand repeat-containing protein n=1 Tax=Klebsiella pneumoniae TaxID=573 RepID=UPI003F212B56